MVLLAAMLFTAEADAGVVTLSGSGGFDYPTRQLYAGPELALVPTNTHGPALVGYVAPSWGFGDARPIGMFELGFLHVVKSPDGLVRVGAIARGSLASLPYGVPWTLAKIGENRFGFVPGLLLHAEFEYGGTDAPLTFTFAARGGLAKSQANFNCPDPEVLTAGCVVWDDGFIGSLELRFRVRSGLYVDAHVGPLSRVAVGYAFPRKPKFDETSGGE